MRNGSQDMEFTGERFVPGVRGDIELEHLHRYLQALEVTAGKVVLDIASGEGYGAAMLATNAAKVIGVDISVAAVAHARGRYQKENLEFVAGSCTDIPLPDSSVDLVVSFETIEHHDQHEKMMREVKRVLRPTGILLISSPDKQHYSGGSEVGNPYHAKELYQHEFKQLLGSYFKHSAYFGQRVIYGSAILAESLPTRISGYLQENDVIQASAGIARPVYWIALASDAELPLPASGIFERAAARRDVEVILAEREAQIASLKQTIAAIYGSRSWRLTRPLRAFRRWWSS